MSLMMSSCSYRFGNRQVTYLDSSAGEYGQPLLGGQHSDEPDDEQLHGDALQGGVQGDVISQQADCVIHLSHVFQTRLICC